MDGGTRENYIKNRKLTDVCVRELNSYQKDAKK